MKKNDIALIMGTFMFSFLFYKQSLGLNLLMFSIFLILLLGYLNIEKTKNKYYLLSSILFLTSAISVFIYSNSLSIWAYYLSSSYFIIVNYKLKIGPVNAILFSSFSYISSFFFIIIDFLKRRNSNTLNKSKTNKSSLLLMIFFVSAIILVFFFLYQKANPVFKDFTKQINLDFLDWGWFFFTIWGLLIMYAILYPKVNKRWSLFEENNTKFLNESEIQSSENKFIWMNVDIELERKTGIILFSLLNLLILFINIIDFSFLWSKLDLPEGLTFSEYLHQGIYTLIFSCVLAILLIMFIFRSHINFHRNSKKIKNLAFLWIAQNIIIGLSCAYRNYIYINNYGLTYKRITIYILLVLLIFGLISTIIKIVKKRNFYFIFRINSFAALIMLVTVSIVNWDLIIANHNLKKSKNPDLEYLIKLSNYTLPEIIKHFENESFKQNLSNSENIKSIVFLKYNDLLEKQSTWKSFNYRDYIVLKRIKKLYLENEVKTFILYIDENKGLEKINTFLKLEHLEIKPTPYITNNNYKINLKELEKLKELKHLKLLDLGLTDINGINFSSKLEKIDLSNNRIKDASILSNNRELKTINLSQNPIEEISFIKNLDKLEEIDLSHTSIKELSPLSESNRLKRINLSNITSTSFETLGALKNVQSLSLSNNRNLHINIKLNEVISESKNLREIIIDNIGLNTLEIFSLKTINIANKKIENTLKIESSNLQNIKTLSVNNNNLINLKGIEEFKNLEKLSARDNKILKLANIKQLTNLQELDLFNNPISSLRELGGLSKIKQLHLNNFTFDKISPIRNLTEIEALTMSGGTIIDSETFINFKKLKYLDISKTNLNDLSFIKELENLEVLIIDYHSKLKLEDLYECKKIKFLVIDSLSSEEIRKIENKIAGIKVIKTWDYKEIQKIKEEYKIPFL